LINSKIFMNYISTAMRVYMERANSQVEQALDIVNTQNYAFISEPHNTQTDQGLADLRMYAQKYQPETIILVGIGGSYLGAQALYTIAQQCGVLPRSHLLSVTSVDGTSCRSAYQQACELILSGRSIILAVVTKTGQTFETAAHAQRLYHLMAQQNLRERVVVITDQNGSLAQRAKQEGLFVATLPANLGGRYSVLSVAGCGIIELCGISTQDMRDSAAQVQWVHARESAQFWYAAWLAGYRVYDTFSFIPAYEYLGQWCRQLIGESLGKEGRGFLPTTSLGSQDLHSVVQYYLAGPSLIATQFVGPSTYYDHRSQGSGLFTQAAHMPDTLSLAALHQSILEGVAMAYQEADRPYLSYNLDPGNILQAAAWMQTRMCETVLLGICLGVDPFNQPQVQLYKMRTRALW
jgi:glucose-6-phosphate isomerase